MRLRFIAKVFATTALGICASHPTYAQQKPLTRAFVAGAQERYQINVAIRVETHGVSTEKVGEKAYTDFYTHEASGEVSWRSTRKISSVNFDGAATIEEFLDHFAANCDKDPTSKSFNAALQKSVREACAGWQTTTSINYEEEKGGLIRGLPAASSSVDSDSSLLSLWIRRAFRPSVVLPKTPIEFGTRTEHKVGSPSAQETQPKGDESSEWIESQSDSPSAIWHVSQNLRWIDPPHQKVPNMPGGKPRMRQLFYADALNTMSLLDGSLLKASRSATRETTELLNAVNGLPDPPAFGSKLTITVTILRLP